MLKSLHRLVGEEVYKNNIDILVCAGENAKLMADEALKNGMKKEDIYYFEDKDEILEVLKNDSKDRRCSFV